MLHIFLKVCILSSLNEKDYIMDIFLVDGNTVHIGRNLICISNNITDSE